MLRTLILAAAILLSFVGPALAEDRLRAGDRESIGPRAPANGAITMGERVAIREFFARHYADGRCAPGLARFHNTCIPPSAARRFTVGKPLAASIPASPIPLDLAERVAASEGYKFFYLDGHVLLVASATKVVVDAMSISVAMRHPGPLPDSADRDSAIAE